MEGVGSALRARSAAANSVSNADILVRSSAGILVARKVARLAAVASCTSRVAGSPPYQAPSVILATAQRGPASILLDARACLLFAMFLPVASRTRISATAAMKSF